MLTKDDLSAIGVVVDKKLDKRISPLEKKIGSIEHKVGSMEKDIIYIRKSIGTVVNSFDREYLDLRKRVEQIENHLGIPTN